MADLQVCAFEVRTISAFSEEKLQELKNSVNDDVVLQKLINIVRQGWPQERSNLEIDLRPFWDSRDEISVYDGIVFKGERVIIPYVMQAAMLKLLHSSHQGIVRTKQLARDTLFWPSMNKQIEEIISKCSVCQAARAQQQKEPMLSFQVPKLPYEIVSTDLFELDGTMYLSTFDHYSGYLDVDELRTTTSHAVIQVLKRLFAQHGIPQMLISDNGPQFSSFEFCQFATQWQFKHQTVSARYPQANGMAEKGVQIAKALWSKAKEDAKDPYLALLAYRNTPRNAVLGSPVQRLMSRRTRNRLPVQNGLLEPRVIPTHVVTQALNEVRNNSKEYYDVHAKPLEKLEQGDTIRYRQGKSWLPAKLVSESGKPRSYNVMTPSGQIVTRNRRHLLRTNEQDSFRLLPEENDDINIPSDVSNVTNQELNVNVPIQSDVNVPNQVPSPTRAVTSQNAGTSRSGRTYKVPAKLKDYVLT